VSEVRFHHLERRRVDEALPRILERALGVQLFERSPAGLRLTQAGRDAFEHTTAMFLAGERLVEVLGQTIAPPVIALRVGVSASMSRTIAADFLADEVRITVRDTGIGIDASDLPRVWDRLYRADKSRSERGLGLGLSLVKAFVEAHHGQATVSSTPNSGSTFTVTFPVT